MSSEPRKDSFANESPAAAAHDGALGEEHGDALAAREVAAHTARVVEEIDALGILPGAVAERVEAVAELVRVGELVDQAPLEGLSGRDGRGVHPGPDRLGIALARGRDPVDDLVEEAVEQGVERDLRGRRMADFGEDLGGALELAGGQEARLDAQLLEPATQEETVSVEAKQVDLARRGKGERRAGRGEVVLERPVAAFAGRLEKAVDGLAGLVELGDLAAKLLRLGQAEGGVLNVERDADHGRIGAGGEKAAVKQGERGLLLGIQERQGGLEGLFAQRPVEGESEDLVAAPAGCLCALQQEVAAASEDETDQGDEEQKKEEPSHW